MNHWYGVRFKKSSASELHWYKINKYGARQLIKWSMVLLIIGIVTFFIPFGDEEIWIILWSLMPAYLVIAPHIGMRNNSSYFI